MRQFTIDELSALVDVSRRTVRYYIQEGLVDKPEGAGRGAFYTRRHLEQLVTIRRWQRDGLSLDRIRELLDQDDPSGPPPRPRGPGTVEVWSHIVLDDGLELMVEPSRSNLSPEIVRRLTREVADLVDRIRNEMEEP